MFSKDQQQSQSTKAKSQDVYINTATDIILPSTTVISFLSFTSGIYQEYIHFSLTIMKLLLTVYLLYLESLFIWSYTVALHV